MLKNIQEILEYTFHVLNEIYFEGELPPIVITIMSSPRTNGHFTINREWRVDEERLNEINISAEHLDRNIVNICATLMHECIHYYCHLNGIQDVSSNGRYHNKKFKEEAEKRGVLISKREYIGWSVTEPSEEFIEEIRSHGIEKPIDINRDGERIDLAGLLGGMGANGMILGPDGLPVAVKKKTSTRKYICPCCGNTFRATKDIDVLCLKCHEQFVKVEK